MRLTYPTNIKILRVPCTGKVDVLHLLRCFQEGADGVFCVGCLEGNCHYNQGNLRCRERVGYIHDLLEEIGIEGDRVRMYNLSSGEGPTFAKYAQEMTEHILSLGPNPLKEKSRKAEAPA